MNDAGEIFLLETIKSLKGLKSNSEKAIEQISEKEMHYIPDDESNSVAIIMKHMAGNMLSRFTDFLTTDGEKEWRKRDEEFIEDNLSKEKLFEIWNRGWNCVLDCLSNLKSNDLTKTVYIREEAHTVIRALTRQLTHYAYHTGQIVYICKSIKKSGFKSLSIPRNKSVTQTPN